MKGFLLFFSGCIKKLVFISSYTKYRLQLNHFFPPLSLTNCFFCTLVFPSSKHSFPGIKGVSVYSIRLRPIWRVKTVYIPTDQLDWPTADWGRGGVPRTLPEPHQMQPLHICWEQISPRNWWAGPPVLPVEAVHLEGDFILPSKHENCKIFCTRFHALQWTAPPQWPAPPAPI